MASNGRLGITGIHTILLSLAKEAGYSTYFSGFPCRNGHIAPRYVSNRMCLGCRFGWPKTAAANPRKIALKAGEEFYIPVTPCIRGHLSKRTTKQSACRECQSIRNQSRENDWRKKNPEKTKIHRFNSNLRRKNVLGKITQSDLDEILKLQRFKCAICKKSFTKKRPPTKDHIIPIAKGGTNYRRNIQLVHGPCNSRKQARLPEDFARMQGLLI